MMTDAQLYEYVATDEFRRRCAAVRARQESGEDLTPRQMAAALPALRVPLWFVHESLKHFVRLAMQRPS
jgi:hypothetical protein